MNNTTIQAAENPVFAFLNGKAFTLDGVHGTFKHSCYVDRHGLTVNRLDHNPSAAGKRSEAYRKVRQQLRDDWSTDLTDSIETYCKIATDLGFK